MGRLTICSGDWWVSNLSPWICTNPVAVQAHMSLPDPRTKQETLLYKPSLSPKTLTLVPVTRTSWESLVVIHILPAESSAKPRTQASPREFDSSARMELNSIPLKRATPLCVPTQI